MEWASEQPRTIHSRQHLSYGGEARSVEPPPHLVAANAGDHALVYSLLRAVNQAPARENFNAWLDEPSYEPVDRLLLKRGDQIIAHVQILHRAAWFHGVKLPVAGLLDLAILPEYVPAGYQRTMIAAAEQAMRDSGAVVSLVRAEQPEPLLANGWSEVRAGGHSRANLGDVLAHLSSNGRPGGATRVVREVAAVSGKLNKCAMSLQIRRWRQVELRSLRAVYESAAGECWGSLCRTDPYWQWLVGRQALTELIVAVESPHEPSEAATEALIVGYAVMHGSQVLELFCLPGHARARPKLLARACQDAIERDHHTISLHTSASDSLHELVVTAGGSWCSDRGAGGALLVKLLDPYKWIEAIFPLLRSRAKAARLPRPLEICFDTGAKVVRLVLTRRSSRLIDDPHGRPDVHCDPATFDRLLIGNLEATSMKAQGDLAAASDAVLIKVATLFPPALFWQSQFDMLRS